MPADSKGQQMFLDYWLYAVLKTSRELGHARVFLRKVEEEMIRKLLDHTKFKVKRTEDVEAACRAYTTHLERMGVLDARDFEIRAEGDGFHVQMGASCPYRHMCGWVHDEGEPVECFRATALSGFLRVGIGRAYDGRLESFGPTCDITLKRNIQEAADGN